MDEPFKVNREELAYAAGLFEGEGTVRYEAPRGRVRLSVSMTDLDPLERFYAAIGGLGTFRGPYQPTVRRKNGELKYPYWYWQAQQFEQAQAIIAMLWPWLGDRRRARATEALTAYRNDARKRRQPWRSYGRTS